jgi:putative tricarboxylic transport membrane protein
MVFAIACLGSMMSQNPLKSLLAALIGLGLATVGVDANTGVYRFTFDSVHLSDGVQFIVVVIGLFSVSEILLMLESTSAGQKLVRKTGRLLFNRKEAAECVGPTLRSSVIGFFVGILPGAGATIASALTYMTEKKISGNSETFGKGDIRGVAAPEAANNASACGSFIPMLTLGVPGSGTTAVMMGALTLYNITPGPAMFTEQPDIVWGLIAALLIANVILLIMNLPLVGLFTRMLTIPLWFLVPAIAAVSAVGVYAVHSTTFDLLLMVGLGVFGYILRKMHFPMSPLILGFVLGEMLEQNLRRALSISNGEFSILWGSGITQTLLVLAVSVLVLPLLLRRIRKRRLMAEAAKAE